MRKGIQAVETAMEEAAKGGGGFTGRLGYFSLKNDETIAVRFLTDMSNDVLTLDFYEFIEDNKGKPQNFAVAADVYDDPNATDWVKELGGQQKDYGTKDLVEPYPKTRSVALAVVQREVAVEGPKGRPVLTYEDDIVEIESKKGEKFLSRKFIIVKQAYKNFWGPLKTHFEENGTICDRVYKIKRVGGGTDTNYSFMEKTADDDWDYSDDSVESVKALQAHYGYGNDGKDADGEDIPDEDRFMYCPMTLEEWAQDSCSEKRVKFFLGDIDAREDQEQGVKSDVGSDDDSDEAQAAPPPPSSGNLQSKFARHKK